MPSDLPPVPEQELRPPQWQTCFDDVQLPVFGKSSAACPFAYGVRTEVISMQDATSRPDRIRTTHGLGQALTVEATSCPLCRRASCHRLSSCRLSSCRLFSWCLWVLAFLGWSVATAKFAWRMLQTHREPDIPRADVLGGATPEPASLKKSPKSQEAQNVAVQ